MKKEIVEVVRPFMLDGEPTKVGQVIEVPVTLAIELRTANKVKKTDKPLRPPREPEGKSEQNATKSQKGEK